MSTAEIIASAGVLLTVAIPLTGAVVGLNSRLAKVEQKQTDNDAVASEVKELRKDVAKIAEDTAYLRGRMGNGTKA